jgi:hypothetical protein
MEQFVMSQEDHQPQIQFGTAPGTNVNMQGSYFRLYTYGYGASSWDCHDGGKRRWSLARCPLAALVSRRKAALGTNHRLGASHSGTHAAPNERRRNQVFRQPGPKPEAPGQTIPSMARERPGHYPVSRFAIRK